MSVDDMRLLSSFQTDLTLDIMTSKDCESGTERLPTSALQVSPVSPCLAANFIGRPWKTSSSLRATEGVRQILASGHAIRVERHRIFSTSQLLQVLTVPSSAPDVNVPEDVRAVEKFLLANAGDL
eukprot:753819-Hanusia_phi.AAC.5